MTSGPKADPTDLPNADLPDSVIAELWRARIPRENFSAVLSAFGRIPADAQYDLAVRLVNAAGIFHLRKVVEQQKFPRAHERRDQLESISTLASRLLALLGVNEPKSVAGGVRRGSVHPTATSLLMWLYRVAIERRPGTPTASAEERLTTLIMLLSDLVEAAERSAREVSTRPGLGGDRRTGELTPEGELIQAIIKLYIDFRNRFPSSGPKVAFDKRLRAFVRSGLELAVSCVRLAGPDGKKYEPWHMAAIDCDLPKPTRTTDDAIRGAFQRVHKPKENRDLI
jgi:hypothetical protein